MASQTFYQKYRSRNFDEIVGQQHVVQTIKNAILNDRVSHAYIFSGPRGTGKTSMARIIAKALNCRKGPSIDPCLTCDLCQKISQGQSVDVIEMDAASHTGVDNIRDLNDQANFAAVECLYRIFIIDEAHMLSTGAFNALLKTLEEPPEKTLFILATTEPQKIPVTIHSRCQHLQLRKMKTSELVHQLSYICEQENLASDQTALTTIARNSSGCMRDAISLLEQVVAFKGESFNQDDVLLALGATSFDTLFNLLEALIKKQAQDVMEILRSLFDDGINGVKLAKDLAESLKQLAFISLDLSPDLDEGRLKQLKTVLPLIEFSQLQMLLEGCAKIEMDARWFPDPELLIQIRLLGFIEKMQSPASEVPVQPVVREQVKPVQERPVQERPSIPTPQFTPQPKVEMPVEPVQQRPETVVANESKGPFMGPKSDAWAKCMEHLKKDFSGTYFLLRQAKIIDIDENEVCIHLPSPYRFIQEKLNEPKNMDAVNITFKLVLGSQRKLTIGEKKTNTSDEQPETGSKSNVPKETDWKSEDETQSKKINTIVRMFEGTLAEQH